MKKHTLLYIIFFSVLIFSCKKDRKEPVDTTGKLHVLNLRLSGFSQTQGPIDATNSKLKINDLDPSDSLHIIYRIYDSDGKVLKTIIHLPDDPQYNNFTDSVPSGTYTVIFAAGYDLFKLDGNQLNNDFFWYYDQSTHDDLTTMGAVLWKDFFYKKLTLTVSGQDITQNVELQRKLAKVELNIEDAIPANVKKIELSFSETNVIYLAGQDKFYTLEDGGGHSDVTLDNKPSKNVIAGNTNNNFSTLTGNVDVPFKITVNCYDNSNNVIVQRKMTITCKSNKVTLISGKLFNTKSQNSLAVVSDTTWNSERPPIKF